MARLTILAPLSGQVWPLERVPDPVFAQKLVGDGLSIDPTDAVLLAGCDGEVIALHAAGRGSEGITGARGFAGSGPGEGLRHRD